MREAEISLQLRERCDDAAAPPGATPREDDDAAPPQGATPREDEAPPSPSIRAGADAEFVGGTDPPVMESTPRYQSLLETQLNSVPEAPDAPNEGSQSHASTPTPAPTPSVVDDAETAADVQARTPHATLSAQGAAGQGKCASRKKQKKQHQMKSNR